MTYRAIKDLTDLELIEEADGFGYGDLVSELYRCEEEGLTDRAEIVRAEMKTREL